MFYYLEKDGQVFLLKKKGTWVFPSSKKDVPCPIEQGTRLPMKEEVVFCHPRLKSFPSHWAYKDDIPSMENVDPIVQKAVNRSLVRQLASGVVERDGKILMVKSIRGMGSGFWKLPGGFVSFAESPQESVVREILEETQVTATVGPLVLMETGIRELYFTSFTFVCTYKSGEAKADGEEIGEIKWIPLAQAIAEAEQPFIRKALEAYRDWKRM